MGITLNELKAQVAAKASVSAVPAVAATEAPQAEAKKSLMTKSMEAMKSTGRAIDGSLPVSKRMFAEMATKRLDGHDVELRLLQHQMELLAHNTGQVLPTREELVAYDAQLELEKAEAEKQVRDAELAAAPQKEVSESVINQLAAAMAKILTPQVKEEVAAVEQAPLLKDNKALDEYMTGKAEVPAKEEVVVAEEPVAVEEPVKEEVVAEEEPAEKETVPAEPKKEKKAKATGRRKLPRNAPLMP